MAKLKLGWFTCVLVLGLTAAGIRQSFATDSATATSAGGAIAAPLPADSRLSEVVVIAHRLDETLGKASDKLDAWRDEKLLPKLGATEYRIDQQALQALPQGKNTPLDKVLLQIPGVSYDSAISNPDFHVRNEYSNVQYRINGIQLPDGVSALGPVLETGFIGNLNLLDGVLPAEYGLRTAGVVDITSKATFDPGGNLDLYAGSLSTVSPSIEYGGSTGQTEYFFTGRYLESGEGLENAMPTATPIHDRTTQEKFFGYGSTLVGDGGRLTALSGGFIGHFQIPDVEGQQPLGDFGSSSIASTHLNENETDRFFFGLVALQTHSADFDTQLSVFTRYATIDFEPDEYGDLAFNDVAAAVVRKSLLEGVQFDSSQQLGARHTLRAGLSASVEATQVRDLATVLPLDAAGNPLPTPVTLNDDRSKTGWNAGGYLQDEWQLTGNLTLDSGLRFDQMNQFVAANQWSPRIALRYTAVTDTTLHAGVARYFTPPMQAQSTPNHLTLFANTTQQAAISEADPVRPERATYVDIGADQKLLDGLSIGLDVYYKRSTDTLDDGQFGQAVVLDEYNYARGFSRGAEFKLNYSKGGFRAYLNVAHEITRVKEVVSNQYLIDDPVEFAYLASHYTYASDAQTDSASAGTSYRWHNLLISLDGIYGSGLRADFANEGHSPGYMQWNGAVAAYFDPWHNQKPLSLRLSAVNLFDRSYVLREATGVGEFAPQYGPRREIFAEVTQKF